MKRQGWKFIIWMQVLSLSHVFTVLWPIVDLPSPQFLAYIKHVWLEEISIFCFAVCPKCAQTLNARVCTRILT